MAKPKKKVDEAGTSSMALAWYESLETKLAGVFLLLLALLTGGAYWANRVLVGDGLLDESRRYENTVASHAAESLNDAAHHAHLLANSLAQLASDPTVSLASLRAIAPKLAAQRDYAMQVSGFGIWPEPRTALAGGKPLGGMLWLSNGQGGYAMHEEMNSDKAPYQRERWYTPGRYLPAGNCLWTGVRQELVSAEAVISCVVPILTPTGFGGVVTVSLAADALGERLNTLPRERDSYLLLLDGQQKLIAATSNAERVLGSSAKAPALPQIAKDHPDYNELAVAMAKQSDAADSRVVSSSSYKASSVSDLKDATRDLGRDEAEDILISIWGSRRQGNAPQAEPRNIPLRHDAVLDEPATVQVYSASEGAWQLLRVTPVNNSFAGVSYVFMQALIITLLLVTATLVLVYFGLRGFVIRPLREFARQLEGADTVEESLKITLDESHRNEVGLLAHWQNERSRQLADALSATRSAKTQLSNESGERKQLQEQLARAQERSSLALQSVTDAVMITDDKGLVEDMNPTAEVLTGVTLRQARGRALEDVLKLQIGEPASLAPNIARAVVELGNRIEYPDELTLTAVNGHPYDIALSAAPMRARNRITGVVIVFRERGVNAPAAITLSPGSGSAYARDLVTGLPTRSACEKRIESMIEQAKHQGATGALIYLDIDHLKKVNDFGGQAAGDDVLVRTAETLAGAAPNSTDIYRLSADQFAVIVENVREQTGMAVAEELRGRLASTRFYWESRYFSVTGSFGVCPVNAESLSALEVIRRADDACAAAKRAGRNAVQLYDPKMDRVARVVDDDAWVRCIRRGLDENLFHLRTQWIMPSSEFAAEGHCFEILLALEDEEGFWASPAAFMPVAERHRLMVDIDRWVISNTLNYLEAHPQIAKGLGFCAINLSTHSLADQGFLEFMVGQLENRISLASKLCFEVRELTLTEHPAESLLCCDALHKMGCKLSVDHYLGRYMSDLTLVRRMHIDFVKVDALSYKNLSSDPVEQMLVESTLRIARHLRRRVVVTGIEDPRAQETWRKLGASYFQGFAFAKPSPVIFLPPE